MKIVNNNFLKIKWIIAIFLFATFASCKQKDNKNYTYFHDSGSVFSTGFNIKYAYDRSLENEILEELHKFDMSLNPFNKKSIIHKVNNNEEVELDSFFVHVFNKATEISKNTDGYFDITVSPLINAWGFGFEDLGDVTPELIDSLKEFVGYEKISISPENKIVKQDERTQINTSAIAKGYACDVVANLLKRHNIENYMVEIGGEIVVSGVNDKGNCWQIGIDKPIEDILNLEHDLQTILSLCNKSLATSGNYRNYYVRDGKKYAHTIDPKTGYTSHTDVLSATVLANDCMTADAYATAFVAMGMQKSIEVASKIDGLEYYFIYDNEKDGRFDVIYSDGFEKYINK